MGRTDGLPGPPGVDDEEELTTAQLLEVGRRRLKQRLNTLDGVALVRAVSMLEALVKQEANRGDPTGTTADILDVVANTELPTDRKIALLDAEWQRLMDRIGAVARYLEDLTGSQKEIDNELRQQRQDGSL